MLSAAVFHRLQPSFGMNEEFHQVHGDFLVVDQDICK